MPEKKKKDPTLSTAKKTSAGSHTETPKGSRESVPPSGPTVAVPLVTIDADAGASPQARAAGTALVWLCAEGRDEDVTELAMEARNDLAGRVHDALDAPARADGAIASVMTDIVVRHVVSKLTGAEVLAMIQGDPELVLEAERAVAASLQAKV